MELFRKNFKKYLKKWNKVEQSGKWPQQACTTMFFLIPKNVTSERLIALTPTLIRWWKALRAPAVAKWRGAQRTVWEVMMEMERSIGRAKAEDLGSGLGEDF